MNQDQPRKADKNPNGYWSSPLPKYWELVFYIIMPVIIGGFMGYLTSFYYVNRQDIFWDYNKNINAAVVDLTKKIVIADPQTDLINQLNQQLAGVYNIDASDSSWWQKLNVQNQFLGTAMVVTSDGWLMASPDVISDLKKEYLIITHNGNRYYTKDLVEDKLTAAVFLKIDAQNLYPVKFTDWETLPLGQSITVLANSGNLVNQPNVINTNIENLNYYSLNVSKDYFHSSEVQDQYLLIKDQLPLSFTGGLAVTLDGEIIGLGQKLEKKADNFQTFIPGSYLQQALKNFLTDKKIVRRNYLGLVYLDLSHSRLPENLTANRKTGIILLSNVDLKISAIKKDSPAIDILKEGDIIYKVDNQEINERNNFTKIINDYMQASKITLSLIRDNEEKTVEIVLK